MQAGLALAVSDLVELRRFAIEEGVGVVFEPGSAAAIRGALNELAADPARLEAMRSAARAAAARYDWTLEKRKLIDLYATLGRR